VLSVAAVNMWGMGAKRSLRRIGEPMVAGARIRTRIHLTAGEAEALTVIGSVLGSVYRGELAGRIGDGVLDRERRAAWRGERKQAIRRGVLVAVGGYWEGENLFPTPIPSPPPQPLPADCPPWSPILAPSRCGGL
jgi:hypothetical protein